MLGEDGVNDGGHIDIVFFDDGMVEVGDSLAESSVIPGAGLYQSVANIAAVPVGTRHIRVRYHFVSNEGGGTLAGWDDCSIVIGPPASGGGEISLVNGDFEEGDLTGWAVGAGSPVVADAATTGNSDPHGGDFYTRAGSSPEGGTFLFQQFSLLALGYSPTDIDAGSLNLVATAWVLGEDGVNDGGRVEAVFLDAAMSEISVGSSGDTITAAGVWVQVTLDTPVPADTRFVRFLYRFVTNSGGGTFACWDDCAVSIDLVS